MCHSERLVKNLPSESNNLTWKIAASLKDSLLAMTMLLFYAFTFAFYAFPASAQENSIGEARITPASPLYFLKSIREIVELKFAPTSEVKAIRRLEFATRRIREIKSLANTSHEDLIEPALAGYLQEMQNLNSVVINLNNETIASRMTEVVVLHIDVLLTVYGKVSHPRVRMSTRAAIFRLSEQEQDFADKLNKLSKPHLAEKVLVSKLSGCQFLAKEASSSALNEVERAVLTERVEKCFNNIKKLSF